MCKGSQPRNFDDLFRLKPRAKDPIHIIKLMKSIIPFFIHSIPVLTRVYEQEKSRSNI